MIILKNEVFVSEVYDSDSYIAAIHLFYENRNDYRNQYSSREGAISVVEDIGNLIIPKLADRRKFVKFMISFAKHLEDKPIIVRLFGKKAPAERTEALREIEYILSRF